MIQLFRVSKEYGRFRHALADVTCTIERGEFVFLTGPSGAGKSTFLKLLFRDEPPTSGQILVNGRNIGVLPASQIPYFRRSVGVVFQDFKLIRRKSVFENIAFVQNVLGLSRAEQKRRAYQVLKRVGLHHQMNAFPDELSGGEQQRVAIARAIVNEPTLLLADEPTGALDSATGGQIVELLQSVRAQRGTTILLVTNDPDVAEVADRILRIRDGRLEEAAIPSGVPRSASG